MYARPPVSASSERKTAMKYTRHAQSTPPRESGSTCKKAEKSRWRSGNVSQCFLQPLTLTRSASLTAAAVSQTCAVTWGVQITWGRGRELRFRAIHTQPLANHLSFSSFPMRCCYGQQAGAGFQSRVVLQFGSYLTHLVSGTEKKTHKTRSRIRSSG